MLSTLCRSRLTSSVTIRSNRVLLPTVSCFSTTNTNQYNNPSNQNTNNSHTNSSYYSQNFHENALEIIMYPGSRTLRLSNSDHGNVLSLSLLEQIGEKVRLYEENNVISAVLIASDSPDMFSVGLSTSVSKEEKASLTVGAHKALLSLSTATNSTVAVYGGLLSGSAYGVFAGCRYRLGTSSTTFYLAEHPLTAATGLPGCGLAYFFANGCPEGMAMVRYLAVSGRRISAQEMYTLGLLTHIVPDKADSALARAIAETVPDDDYTKAVQPSPVNREVKVLEDILDTLDVKSFIPPMNFGNGPTDSLLDDPIWKKMFLVEPIPLKDEDLLGEDPGEDLEEVVNQVMFCFENDAPAETLARLSYMAATPAERQALDKKIKDTVTDASAMRSFAAIKKVVNENFSDDKSRRFAQDALEGFQKCDQELVEKWYKHTRYAASSKKQLSEVLAEEISM